MPGRILTGNCMDLLAQLEAHSVQTVVTSPPYYGLRDYGIEPVEWPEVSFAPMPGLPGMTIPPMRACLGLEPDIWSYVGHMVAVFREVRRALKRDGTLWLNLGDSYATGAGAVGQHPGGGAQGERWKGYRGTHTAEQSGKAASRIEQMGPMTQPNRMPQPGLKPKDLMGIPWRVAFALQADGWYLRNDVVWQKVNAMPESVRDRCTKAHEYVFFFSRSRRYYFDAAAIAEPCTQDEWADGFRGGSYVNGEAYANTGAGRKTRGNIKVPSGWDTGPGSHSDLIGRYAPVPVPDARLARSSKGAPNGAVKRSGNLARKYGEERDRPGSHLAASIPWEGSTRNKRDVWTIAAQPFGGAHFATMPPSLAEPCILAGSRPGDTVLDPFLGAGTTGLVADRLQRDWIGIEQSVANVALAHRRIIGDAPLFAQIATTIPA